MSKEGLDQFSSEPLDDSRIISGNERVGDFGVMPYSLYDKTASPPFELPFSAEVVRKIIEDSNEQLSLLATHIDNQARELQKERQNSELDDKTGLLKDSVFKKKIKEQLSHSRRKGEQNSKGVFMLGDLDFFKQINDAIGLRANDNQCLIPAANVILRNLRQDALAGRFGGDEFSIFVPDVDIKTGWTIATRIHDRINEIKFGETEPGEPIKIGDRDFLGISMGLVEVRPDDVYEEVFDRANLLVTAAKKAGRNRIVDDAVLKRLVQN